MSFLGKEYTFERQENFEGFINSVGLSEERAQGYLNYKPNQTLKQNGDSYTLISTTPAAKRELTFTPGVTFEEHNGDRISQTTFTLEGNKLTQVQKFTDGLEITYVRVFSDDQLFATYTNNRFNGQAYRYFKAL